MKEEIQERLEIYKSNIAQLRKSMNSNNNQNVSYYTTRREIKTLERVIFDIEFILNG